MLLIDPRQERRAITHRLIERCPDLTVAGVASTLDEAVAQLTGGGADIALVEIQMPVEQGLATVAALRQRSAALRIIVCSFHQERATREAAARCGADGYLTKPLHIASLLALLGPTAEREGSATTGPEGGGPGDGAPAPDGPAA